jgi:Cys-tRNA(Pro)/Cys-tRNA(Cys) deacylase
MTPAVNLLKKRKIKHRIHTYDHDPGTRAYGEEAADKLGVSPDRLFKTLVCVTDSQQTVVAVVPVSKQLNLKQMAKAVNVKKAKMAGKKDVERITGYLPGGVSPISQKKRMPTVIDASALGFETIYVSAGRRGVQAELSPQDLKGVAGASFVVIAG